MELKDYTSEQLSQELARRKNESRPSLTPRPWPTASAIVEYIDKPGRGNGGMACWKYSVQLLLEDSIKYGMTGQDHFDVYLKTGTFNRENAPDIGDIVTIRFRDDRIPYWLRENIKYASRIIAVAKKAEPKARKSIFL